MSSDHKIQSMAEETYCMINGIRIIEKIKKDYSIFKLLALLIISSVVLSFYMNPPNQEKTVEYLQENR